MSNPAVAAIEYALGLGSDAHDFLNHWVHGDFPEIREAWPEAPEAIYIGADPMHPETRAQMAEHVAHHDDIMVDNLAAAMKAKMAAQRAKGYAGWDDPRECPTERLQAALADHVLKGDPVDVANFCGMLLARGEGTAPRQVPVYGCIAPAEGAEPPRFAPFLDILDDPAKYQLAHPAKQPSKAEIVGEYLLSHMWAAKLTNDKDGSPKTLQLNIRASTRSNEHMYGPVVDWVEAAVAKEQAKGGA